MFRKVPYELEVLWPWRLLQIISSPGWDVDWGVATSLGSQFSPAGTPNATAEQKGSRLICMR